MEEPHHRRLVSVQDVVLLVILLVGYVVTIFVPRCWDREWIEFVQRCWLSLRSHSIQNLAAIIKARLQEIGAAQSIRVAQEHHRILVEFWCGRFRSIGPRGWRPEIEIKGREYLDVALESGRGVVL